MTLVYRLILAMGVATLFGCSSLPQVAVGALDSPARPAQIEGTQGPLAKPQQKAVADKLKGDSEETRIVDRHLAREDAIVASPLLTGNQVQLLIDGPATFASIFAAIQSARNHINLETYIFEDDEIGQRLADALISKQKEGVQVNLIYDSVGSLATPKEFFQRMSDSGIHVLEYNPVNLLRLRKGWNINQRDHRKLLIVDGQVAFVGGINISSVYSSGSRPKSGKKKPDKQPWRDTHVRIEGPVATEFQKLFIETWARQHGAPLSPELYFPTPQRKGSEVVRAIGSSPEESFSLMYATLLSAISSAESEVYITSAYFVPDVQLLGTLQAAARRGVDVRLLLPSNTDSALVLHASHAYYDKLLRAGVKIYERQDALLHAKTVVIDGVWSTIGSTNLDPRSFLHNQEINAVIVGQAFSDKMRVMYQQDLQASTQITLEKWRQRPFSARVKEFGARLWAYWL